MKRQSVSSLEGRSNRPAPRSRSQATARSLHYTGAALAMAALLSACGTPDPQAIDYKSTGKQPKAPSLAIPPDLLTDPPARTDAPAGGDASLSGYRTSPGTPPLASPTVLPASQGLHIERDGSQRWLVVTALPAQQLWERIRAFWQEQGFVLTEDSRQQGVMQTDWLETHARLDQGLIRNTLTLAVNNSYVTGERNRFRTRLEAGPNGATYVFVSQQGLHEVLTGTSNEGSQWESRPNDPGLEADYLGRLQRALAEGPKRAAVGPESMPAPAPVAARRAKPTAGDEPVVPPPVLPAGVAPADGGVELADDYDHAWTRVGNALDRANFTVDSRDRERGLYAMRYVDPNDLGTASQGFWNQVFHGKKEKVATQYAINVRALTPNSTRVSILNAQGQPDTSPLAQRIMRLIVGNL
ncbi:MAG: outer membrane protein assembly factor BamC [Janthinobacterium lividum]